MVRASRCHRLNMKTYIINGSEVSRLSVAIQFYGRNWAGITQEKFICFLDSYIRWYNEKRIKLSLGAMSPVKYRQHLGITT
ncbi:Integrase core domain-containing protein [Cedecea sp. NFIX57]|nr:Integrase core domain-containing protein [Cedecea sp. NFIX57]